MGKDFSARTRDELEDLKKEKDTRRCSKDLKTNKESKKLVDCLSEMGWRILNGTRDI